MTPRHWTEPEVRAYVADAAKTLSRLPFPRHGAPAGLRINWPEVAPTTKQSRKNAWEETVAALEAGRAIAEEREPRQTPTPAQIDRMDIVLTWIYWLTDGRDRAVLLLRALGLSWRRIGQAVGCSHEHARELERRAIRQIIDGLNCNEGAKKVVDKIGVG